MSKTNNDFYVYKFYNKNNKLLYIGQTINIETRFKTHAKEKEWWKEVSYILYGKCNSKSDMDIYEIYYINKLKPKYNISLVGDFITVQLPELNFKNFDGEINVKRMIKQIDVEKYSKEKRPIIKNRKRISYDFRLIGNEILILNIIINSETGLYTSEIIKELTINDKCVISNKTFIKVLKNLIEYGYIIKTKGNKKGKIQDFYEVNKNNKKISNLCLDIKDTKDILNGNISAEDYKIYTFLKYINKNNFILDQEEIGKYFGVVQATISKHIVKLLLLNYIDNEYKITK